MLVCQERNAPQQEQATSLKQFRCEYCRECFSQSTDLVTHRVTHKFGGKSYFIKRFNRSATCKQDKQTQTEENHWRKSFIPSSNSKTHERTRSREKPYACKYCNKRFGWSRHCKDHERTHTGEKPYICKYCNKTFSRSSHCKRHERIHTGKKQYSCPHCKKRFGDSSSCKKHKRTHTGEKPYTCIYCEKSFSDSSTYKRHERRHTGEKPYTCPHCKKSFSDSSACKRHQRTHTRNKPYTCTHCKLGFSALSSYKRHEGTHTEQVHEKSLNPTQRYQEPNAAHNNQRALSYAVSSLSEQISNQIDLTCWICQEKFSTEADIVQHYDDHMNTKPELQYT